MQTDLNYSRSVSLSYEQFNFQIQITCYYVTILLSILWTSGTVLVATCIGEMKALKYTILSYFLVPYDIWLSFIISDF